MIEHETVRMHEEVADIQTDKYQRQTITSVKSRANCQTETLTQPSPTV